LQKNTHIEKESYSIILVYIKVILAQIETRLWKALFMTGESALIGW